MLQAIVNFDGHRKYLPRHAGGIKQYLPCSLSSNDATAGGEPRRFPALSGTAIFRIDNNSFAIDCGWGTVHRIDHKDVLPPHAQ
jgi:hypothetical protein